MNERELEAATRSLQDRIGLSNVQQGIDLCGATERLSERIIKNRNK